VVARAVESSFTPAGSSWDYPEHFRAGLKTQVVREKYYFSRGPQLANRAVDIGSYIDRKVEVNLANVTQGPSGNNGAALRQRLAREGKRLPLLGADDATANRQYTKHFALARDRTRGRANGLQFAELFHYIGPDEDPLDAYVRDNAVSL
jgi:hypothetical protein